MASVIYSRSGVTHRSQLKNRKFRNWIKSELGLLYVKSGIEKFCEDVVIEMHQDILQRVRQNKNTGNIACDQCSLASLKPDHAQHSHKTCVFGQIRCNCLKEQTQSCLQNVCGAIYDCILRIHAGTPPRPKWKNSDAQLWTSHPWAIARCFINAEGYTNVSSASETDLKGLLHLIINCQVFHNHLQCDINGQDIFSKVKNLRNKIMHNHSMELEDKYTFECIDDMITLLQDGKELVHKQEAQEAIKKLEQLKQDDLIITNQSEDGSNPIEDLRAVALEAYLGKDSKRAEFKSKLREEKLKELDEILSARNRSSQEKEIGNTENPSTNVAAVSSGTLIGADNRSVSNETVNVNVENQESGIFTRCKFTSSNVAVHFHNHHN